MVREQTVDVGSRTVRYLIGGQGRPLVLLHAFPIHADMWRPQLERPPDGWQVLAPDLRGLGPLPSAPARSIDDLARDVEGWLEALGIARAVIGGLSMGGYVMFALYRLAPERFSALVLANTKASADSADGRAARDRMSAVVASGGASAVADEILPKLLGETSWRTRPHVVAAVRTMIESNTPDGIDGAIHAMKDRPDSLDLLPRIDRPALVIAGAEDRLIPQAESEALHQRLPQSTLVYVAGAGHLASLEAPDDFSTALSGFLAAQR